MDFTQSSDIFLINWPQHHAFCSSVNFPLAPAQPCVAMLRVIDLNSSTWYFLSFWSFNVTILFTELVIHSRGVKSCPHWKSRKKEQKRWNSESFYFYYYCRARTTTWSIWDISRKCPNMMKCRQKRFRKVARMTPCSLPWNFLLWAILGLSGPLLKIRF